MRHYIENIPHYNYDWLIVASWLSVLVLVWVFIYAFAGTDDE